MDEEWRGHNLIVIGASAGGVEALTRLMRGFRRDLPACILIVMHVGAASELGGVLDRAGPLPVRQAKGGERIAPGRAYVAAPGAHLLTHDGHLLLRRGPRENLSRPAIDPLFRSAAVTHGGRAIGAVLSGALNDGTAGLHAIKRCGGLAVVQDPADAAVGDMPSSALRHVEVDHIAPIAEMAALLTRLAAQPAGETPEIPRDIRLEAAIAAQELTGMTTEDELGTLAPFSCPECHGTLWEIADDPVLRYRCHVGHALTAETMLAAQAEEIEKVLSNLLRTHQERAALARRLADQGRRKGNGELIARMEERASDYEADAELVRQLLLRRDALTAPAAVESRGAGTPDEHGED